MQWHTHGIGELTQPSDSCAVTIGRLTRRRDRRYKAIDEDLCGGCQRFPAERESARLTLRPAGQLRHDVRHQLGLVDIGTIADDGMFQVEGVWLPRRRIGGQREPLHVGLLQPVSTLPYVIAIGSSPRNLHTRGFGTTDTSRIGAEHSSPVRDFNWNASTKRPGWKAGEYRPMRPAARGFLACAAKVCRTRLVIFSGCFAPRVSLDSARSHSRSFITCHSLRTAGIPFEAPMRLPFTVGRDSDATAPKRGPAMLVTDLTKGDAYGSSDSWGTPYDDALTGAPGKIQKLTFYVEADRHALRGYSVQDQGQQSPTLHGSNSGQATDIDLSATSVIGIDVGVYTNKPSVVDPNDVFSFAGDGRSWIRDVRIRLSNGADIQLGTGPATASDNYRVEPIGIPEQHRACRVLRPRRRLGRSDRDVLPPAPTVGRAGGGSWPVGGGRQSLHRLQDRHAVLGQPGPATSMRSPRARQSPRSRPAAPERRR